MEVFYREIGCCCFFSTAVFDQNMDKVMIGYMIGMETVFLLQETQRGQSHQQMQELYMEYSYMHCTGTIIRLENMKPLGSSAQRD